MLQSSQLFSRFSGAILGRTISSANFLKNIGPFKTLQFRDISSTKNVGQISIAQETSQELDSLCKTLDVEIRSGEPAVLLSFSWFATFAAKQLGIPIGHCWAPKRPRHDRLTLLKSVHIYKKHRVQYEVRTYFRHLTFLNMTGSTANTFLEYVQRNLPEGVAMKVTKILKCLDHI
uniref:Small ribosomal subunit protein uS10m n=1 Tax=Alona affinis TaxID=381656 RepID=A0A9N6WR76_9CRUS|nr:EOG090X0GP9 [Alona affinis]